MKKTLTIALAAIMSAAVCAAPAQDKKKKNQESAQPKAVAQTGQFASERDSISYAAGVAATQGLLPFLKQQYGIDTTDVMLKAVAEGYMSAIKSANDANAKAFNTGLTIGDMSLNRILPSMKSALEDTPDSINTDLFHKGFIAGLLGDASMFTPQEAQKIFQTTADSLVKAKNDAYKTEQDAWLAANQKKKGVQTTASGLQYKVIKMGKGEKPTKTDEVEVKYEGKMIDGTIFDSSYERNPQTATFRCDQVIKGWTEALTMMPVGSTWELYIPEDLAYGNRQDGKIKPYSALIFKVELLSVKKSEKDEKKEETKGGNTVEKRKEVTLKPVTLRPVGSSKKK